MPLPMMPPSPTTSTGSPAEKLPSISTIPTGRSDEPRSRRTRAAPSSTTIRPRAGVAQRSQSLKLDPRSVRVGNAVPIRSPPAAASSVPGAVPSQIVTATPEPLAIAAAETLLRMPPDPNVEEGAPIS